MTDRADKFVASDVTVTRPQCHFCQRWIKGTLTCDAFHSGIPANVLMNKVNHFKTAALGDGGRFGIPLFAGKPRRADLFLVGTPNRHTADQRMLAAFPD